MVQFECPRVGILVCHWHLKSYYPSSAPWLIGCSRRHSPLTFVNRPTGSGMADVTYYYSWEQNMRKRDTPNIGWDTGVSVPGAFKLDHLQPVKPILFSKFNNFFTFILGANSYYPRGLIMGKGNSHNSKKWMMQRVFSAWGIQTGPFAAY